MIKVTWKQLWLSWMVSSVLLRDTLATLWSDTSRSRTISLPSILPQHKHASYISVGVTHISSPNPSPPPQVTGIHASGSVQCIMGHWHVALSAPDPLSLIADKHGVQKAQKSCVMSGVTYIRGLLLVAAASRGRPLDTVAAALVVWESYGGTMPYLIISGVLRRTYEKEQMVYSRAAESEPDFILT